MSGFRPIGDVAAGVVAGMRDGATVTIRLGFSAEELAQRRTYLGGSDANILMSGDEERIHRLWLEKTGQVEPEDLSDVLPVQVGIFLEELNARWHAKVTGRPVRSRNAFCPHPARRYMAANLDGLTTTAAGDPAVFEAKCVNAFSNIEEVVQRYQGQLHHAMACAEVGHAVLSVFVGTLKYELFEVALDEFYLCQLLDREKAFWECVERFEPPPRLNPVAPPVPPERWRTLDLTGSNEWADHAATWLETRAAAKRFDGAAKGLKALVPADVGHAHGHGISCKRAKTGALTIREEA